MSYISVEQLKSALNPTGADTAHTAASLPDPHLSRVIRDVETEIDARLSSRYDVPFDDPVPGLVVRIVTDFAAWHATLDWRRTVDLEERDPVALRYRASKELLAEVVSGTADIPGAKERTSGTSGVGEPINLFAVPLFYPDDFALEYSYSSDGYEVC